MNFKLVLLLVLFVSLCVPLVSAQTGDGWEQGEGFPATPTPTATVNTAGAVLVDLYATIYVVCPLLALVFLALVAAGVLKTDSATITVAVLVACCIVIGLCVAFAIMSAIGNANIVPSVLLCLG